MSAFQVYRGPRPTNTLSRGALNSKHTASRGLHAPRQLGLQLDTATTAGYNVRSSTLEYSLDTSYLAEPRPKRRKVEPEPNSQNTPQIVDESDEADQIMMADDARQVKHVTKSLGDQLPGNDKPVVKWRGSEPTSPNAFGRRSGEEFRAVENLMDSSLPKNRKHRNRQKNAIRDMPVTEGSSFASSKSESVELLDTELNADLRTKVPYRGTANLHPSRRSEMASKASLGHSTANRSPHFPFPASETTLSKHQNQEIKRTRGSLATGSRLRDQYRDSDGKQRGGADSPDELGVAGPNSRALSPVKSARFQSPSKISQSDLTRRHSSEDELENLQPAQSDIKPSVFTGVANNGSRSKVATYHGEKQAPWSIPLRAYNFQGQTHNNDGLALVYNENEKSYEIRCSGTNLAKLNLDLQIRPNKLQQIHWAREGTKMRFQSSKIVGLDPVLDIDSCNQKDVQTLNAVLQERSNFLVKGETRERMDQLFEHKLQEDRRTIEAGRNISSRQPEDVQFAERKIDRADKKRALDEQHRPNTKRIRIVDKFAAERKSNDMQWAQHDVIPDKTVIQKYGSTRGPESATAFDLNDLNLLEKQLKHNLRPRNTTRSPFSSNQEASHEETERYSQVHGPGKRWPKPLVYPKEGKKRTTVDFDDLGRLDEGQFLNDNLISFYLRYLEHQAEKNDPTMARKVYMFNTFFYASLTTSKPGQRGINYEAVQKWTRGIDIFTYDFVVVPVNESAHWYIAIICNLPALNRKLGGFDGTSEPDPRSPKQIEFDQPTKDKLMTSSSPRTLASNEDRVDESPPTDRAAEDPKERETTASFAEMSLEAPGTSTGMDDINSEIPRSSHPDDPEQELLDCQLQQAENNGLDGGDPNAQEVESTDRQLEEVVETDKPTSPRLRPGKRKSLPSTRLFDPYKPTILTFDSFGTAHAQTVKVLKQYLREEASDKRGQMEFDEKELQGVTAKQIPQQDNFCDCGLFLLGYMEKFFDDPRDFINKIMRRQWDVQKDWPNLGPSIMRTKLRSLLLELGKSHLEELDIARIARRAKTNLKASMGSPPSSMTPISKPKQSDLDGANSVETTPWKPGLEAVQPLLSRNSAGGSAENIEEPIQQASLSPDGVESKAQRYKNGLVLQCSPSPKEAASESADHADELLQPKQQQSPSSRQAALESALRIDEEVQHQPASDAESHSFRIVVPGATLAAGAPPPPPVTIEEDAPPPPPVTIAEDAPHSFIVPDSQPQSSNAPMSQESDTEPESLAISPELGSTIPDSQPPLPELPFKEDPRKEAKASPPPRSKRHMTSFSSPLPPSKSTHESNEGHHTPPGSPQIVKRIYTPEPKPSSPKTRSSKQRPILGAIPQRPMPGSITQTNPKVVINID